MPCMGAYDGRGVAIAAMSQNIVPETRGQRPRMPVNE